MQARQFLFARACSEEMFLQPCSETSVFFFRQKNGSKDNLSESSGQETKGSVKAAKTSHSSRMKNETWPRSRFETPWKVRRGNGQSTETWKYSTRIDGNFRQTWNSCLKPSMPKACLINKLVLIYKKKRKAFCTFINWTNTDMITVSVLNTTHSILTIKWRIMTHLYSEHCTGIKVLHRTLTLTFYTVLNILELVIVHVDIIMQRNCTRVLRR